MNDAIQAFQTTIWSYYRDHGRHDLPWRLPETDGSFDPYKILVSEIMLQQTQVARVIPKYHQFLKDFPTFAVLAAAPLSFVIRSWSGLGYNRRAKFLWECAKKIMSEHNGQLPPNLAELIKLPGIGSNTAGAVLAYAYNKPVIFVETNIRTVFIYHFFSNVQGVHDREILDLVAKTFPDEPRTWYWALMDYGAHLKQTVGNLNASSKHYIKQSRFEGSARQIRGQVLRLLGSRVYGLKELQAKIPDQRLNIILDALIAEGFIGKTNARYRLK